MINNITRELLSAMLSLLLVIGTAPLEAQAQQTGSTGYSGQGVPLSAEELQQLVAPIALYPDSLVAQILAAATFPDQVAAAAEDQDPLPLRFGVRQRVQQVLLAVEVHHARSGPADTQRGERG